jgi:hypothetical protein
VTCDVFRFGVAQRPVTTCESGAAGGFPCRVTFLSEDDANQRLYFDVVAVARTDTGWELRSGLCKR